MVGAACTTEGSLCDPSVGCSGGPDGCSISRARYKRDIAYLGPVERERYRQQLMGVPLASYRYKHAPDQPQLGFIIEDVEPIVAVAGDHVNLYGYMSMAVAAIQAQDEEIKSLQREVAGLRAQLTAAASQAACEPLPR